MPEPIHPKQSGIQRPNYCPRSERHRLISNLARVAKPFFGSLVNNFGTLPRELVKETSTESPLHRVHRAANDLSALAPRLTAMERRGAKPKEIIDFFLAGPMFAPDLNEHSKLNSTIPATIFTSSLNDCKGINLKELYPALLIQEEDPNRDVLVEAVLWVVPAGAVLTKEVVGTLREKRAHHVITTLLGPGDVYGGLMPQGSVPRVIKPDDKAELRKWDNLWIGVELIVASLSKSFL